MDRPDIFPRWSRIAGQSTTESTDRISIEQDVDWGRRNSTEWHVLLPRVSIPSFPSQSLSLFLQGISFSILFRYISIHKDTHKEVKEKENKPFIWYS